MDPSLQTRPVPRTRQFSVRSYGPGADPDIRQKAVSYTELDALTGYEPLPSWPGNAAPRDELLRHYKLELEFSHREAMREFLEDVQSEGEAAWQYRDGPADLTWGVCVFITSYTKEALQKLDAALYKIIKAVRRDFLRQVDSHSEAYALEVVKRFKLDVILDKDILEDASDDRIREEFNAHVRHLNLWPLGEEDEHSESYQRRNPKGLNRPLGPDPRFAFCFALDEAKILELSEVEFPAEAGGDKQALIGVTVKAIDRLWNYPSWPNGEHCHVGKGVETTYATGADQCPIGKIGFIYREVEEREMGKLYPMSEYDPGCTNWWPSAGRS